MLQPASPVVLERFWGKVWPKIGRKPEKNEYRVANEPLSKARNMPVAVFIPSIPETQVYPGSGVYPDPGMPRTREHLPYAE